MPKKRSPWSTWIPILTLTTIYLLHLTNGRQFNPNKQYSGQYVANFEPLESETVYGFLHIINKTHMYAEHFKYEGGCAESFFWAGTTENPDANGKPMTDAIGQKKKANIVLNIPSGMTLENIKYVSFWCKPKSKSLSTIRFPSADELQIPKESAQIETFTTIGHKVGAKSVKIANSLTFELDGFTYDGKGEEVGFYVGLGTWDSSGAVLSSRSEREQFYHAAPISDKWQIFDEICTKKNLREYKGEAVTLRIGDMRNETVLDIDFLSVYSAKEKKSYGHVVIPLDLRVQPYMGDLCTRESRLGENSAGTLNSAFIALASIVIVGWVCQ